MQSIRRTAAFLSQRVTSSAQAGVTLVELMVAVAMLSLIMMLAVPSFRSQVASAQLTSAANDLLATMTQARAEAIRLGRRVTVCRSANGTSCDTTSGVGWETGWIVFQDNVRSGAAAAVDTGEVITSLKPATNGEIRIIGNSNYVSFAADGRGKDMAGAMLAFTLRVCSRSPALADDARSRRLTLVTAGRLSVARETDVAASCPAP